MPKVRVLCSAGVTQPRRSYDPVRLPPWPLPSATLRTLPSPLTGLPRLPEPPFRRAVPTTPADRAGAHVDCFPRSLEPSPSGRWVGIRIVTFGACSGFTHVTARRIAQPPKATFVTRLQPSRLPSQAARQLPDLSTILRVESSSTGVSRLRGALPDSEVSSIYIQHAPVHDGPPSVVLLSGDGRRALRFNLPASSQYRRRGGESAPMQIHCVASCRD